MPNVNENSSHPTPNEITDLAERIVSGETTERQFSGELLNFREKPDSDSETELVELAVRSGFGTVRKITAPKHQFSQTLNRKGLTRNDVLRLDASEGTVPIQLVETGDGVEVAPQPSRSDDWRVFGVLSFTSGVCLTVLVGTLGPLYWSSSASPLVAVALLFTLSVLVYTAKTWT
ncbi:hypothetical protein SAMN04487950_2338 [Halogranum rubrum]|uniref:Uncharacterized protein n=1 Tax=Halogranum rubrum TaxID=553466 RepID=A0A1I4EVD5_9EURY|nr:hypothetical protein [Halogranum rubrum]SFL08091.1 hypothetical protein SAMN04487950_2338 [Halogranum rubrum]